MSCAAPGECSASGYYKDADGYQGYVVTQTDRVWGVAKPVPGLKDLHVVEQIYPSFGSVSCAAPGECSATGTYKDADGYQGYVVTQTGGVWGVAKPVPGLKDLNVVEQIYPFFGSVSCAAPGECVATGTYKDADGNQGYVVTQTGGVWGDAEPVPGLKALNVGNDVSANADAGSVSCAAPGACYATGSYTDADGHQQGFVVDVLSGYRPIAPTRAVDTRDNGGARVPAGSKLVVDVGAQFASQSISVNLAATDAVGPGFATLFACDQDRPGTASLNFQAGEAISNGVITKVSAQGTVCVFVHQSTHLVLDVFGVFPSESAFAPVAPTRAVDTRDNGGARVPAGSELTVSVGAQYAGQSISVNLAATDAVGPGFATLFACDQDRPGTASLNFQAGEAISNGVITKVSAEGTVCVFVNQSTHLVLDVFGVFATLDAFAPVAPTRAVDTRDNGGARVPAGSKLVVDVGAQFASQSISVNLAATDAVGPGFATLFACDQDRPGTASLNFQAGEDISNGVITKVSAQGTVCVFVTSVNASGARRVRRLRRLSQTNNSELSDQHR